MHQFWPLSKTSLAQRLTDTGHRPSGFDYLRLFLSLGVIGSHSVLLTGSDWIYQTRAWSVLGIVVSMIVPMFFALSGFLVAGSLERSGTLTKFLGLRVLRLMPALSVEVFISAIFLGVLFTTLDLSAYFRSDLFHRYFFNLIGHIQYYLPGVFEQNPNHLVNGQLWTVPFELVCYVLLAILAILGAYNNGRWLIIFLIGCYIFQIANTAFRPNYEFKGAGGTTAVIMFMCGIFFYKFREKIPWSGAIALICVVISVKLSVIPNGMRFCGLPVAYFTIYLGLLNPPRNSILLSGDYSYGLYLYGYPVQQAVVAAAPALREWYWNLLFSVPLACIIAVGSWWLVERPCLRARFVLDKFESWRQSRRAAELSNSSP